jgi:hypothetical protein
VIADVTKLARLRDRAHRDEDLQVPCSGSARGFRDGDVVFRANVASEAVDSFPEDAGNDFFLALVQLAAHELVKPGFRDIKIHPLDSVGLRLIDRLSDIDEPIGDFDIFIVVLEGAVIGLPGALDGIGEGNQGLMAEILRERCLCERAQCGRCHPRTDEYRRSEVARCRRASARAGRACRQVRSR